MEFSACIVAAGRGERAGGGVPKQFRVLAGKPVLAWSAAAFDAHPDCAEILIAHPPGARAEAEAAVGALSRPVRFVEGAAARTGSVRALVAAARSPLVLVHDAARPGLTRAVIDGVLAALADADGAAPVLAIADALVRPQENFAPVDRAGIGAVQTPQGFHRDRLLAAFEAAGAAADFPDETALARAAGLRVAASPGAAETFKLTWPEDFARFECLNPQVQAGATLPVFGSGYDVHRLAPGDGVTLGGVFIACPLQLVGHSDADAGLHALTDAVLGAAAAGDIGQHFPPSDPRWRGAASDRFLAHALDLARAAGVRIVHADLTLICERPKIGPHRDAMRARIAALMGLPESRVNVKATTTEGLGFTGRGEGLAAQAVVGGVTRA